jgi:hypothetical protein
MQPRTDPNTVVHVENLLRQSLLIGDPSDPEEVAQGLARRYSEPAARLARDRAGLPAVGPLFDRRPVPESPSGGELSQARDDVERDLQALIVEPQLKNLTPELRGWRDAILGIVEDGANAAHLALDRHQRDRAIDCRRRLGDYARLSRLLGAATPQMNGSYRQLAKSLDASAAMILVIAGEAVAAQGRGGTAPLPAPASDLQARREAVLAALRVLTGATQHSYGISEWPRGLHALRELYQGLENSGHGDLRAMLDERHLGRIMDSLIERAAAKNPSSLRALGATALVAVAQFERLLELMGSPDPESPPLSTFRNALRLFIDGFKSDRGRRLVSVARPPLVFYGLYGVSALDAGEQRLFQIISWRGRLASELDCYLGCGCEADDIVCQAVLDKLLYDTDRAVDLYLQGDDSGGSGQPEQRAAAFGILMRLLTRDGSPSAVFRGLRELKTKCGTPSDKPPFSSLDEIAELLLKGAPRSLLQRLIPQEAGPPLLAQGLSEEAGSPPWLGDGSGLTGPQRATVKRMRDELCAQRRSEARWIELAQTMTPGCVDLVNLGGVIDQLLAAGLYCLGGNTSCPNLDDDIPPHLETAVAGTAYARHTDGFQPSNAGFATRPEAPGE